jgi:hypothetical protein
MTKSRSTTTLIGPMFVTPDFLALEEHLDASA